MIMMANLVVAVLFLLAGTTSAFTVSRTSALVSSCRRYQRIATSLKSSVDAQPQVDLELDNIEVPTFLPSAMGIDYVPLATMLAIGDYEGADQFTRDNLIKIAGPGAVKRGFVYWTEVKNIPSVDFATMERLWLLYSNGNFGYSVQKRVWEVESGNFDNAIKRIGWTTTDENKNERKLKWFGKSEFIYNLSAPKGHLPLTSALRGTQLMKELMKHPFLTEYDWKNYKDLKWSH